MINLLFCFPLILHFATANDCNTAGSKFEMNITELTKQCIEGTIYIGKTGIHLRSEASGETNSISITATPSGKNIFSSAMLDQRTTLMSVMGGNYLLVHGHQYKDDTNFGMEQYCIPNTWRRTVPKLLKLGVHPKYLSQMRYLYGCDADTESTGEFQKFLHSEEALVVHRAALELGRRGLFGKDSSGIMVFYVLAMRLANLLPTPKGTHDPFNHCPVETSVSSVAKPVQESFLSTAKDASRTKFCGRSGHYCERCPMWKKQCAGMCGVGCECWEMVCGDCCFHRDCLGHSRRCGNTEHASFECFNVFGFKCDNLP